MKTLNIVGCGRAASTLARLWHAQGVLTVGDILNRSVDSAERACAFIGAGHAVSSLAEMSPADVWLLGVPDREIVAAAEQLAAQGWVGEGGKSGSGSGVFHLSGFTSSAELRALKACGARCASVHPVFSFADPAGAAMGFSGTLCGVEGDRDWCVELVDLFAAIGAVCFPVDANNKPLYHAGSVFASNFLVVIMDVALRAYRDAGVPDDVALRLLDTLSRGTRDNVVAHGARNALTGPAARGDREVVEIQQAVVSAWHQPSGSAYDALTDLAFMLADKTQRL